MARKKKKSSNRQEVENAAKTLLANIRFMSPDNPVRTVMLTSSVPNEGKSTVSVELARAMASAGSRVLLVEADMRRRSLAGLLNVHARQGVYAVLSGQTTLSQAAVRTRVNNLWLLDVEPNIPNPADILSSKAYHKMVTQATAQYDYVIFDTPPVGTFVDAAILSTMVDGVIMVVKMESTRRDEVIGAVEQLRNADANILGICGSFCEGTGSEYYYAYYTQDGKRAGNSKGHSSHTPEPIEPELSQPAATPAASASSRSRQGMSASGSASGASGASGAADASAYSRGRYGSGATKGR